MQDNRIPISLFPWFAGGLVQPPRFSFSASPRRTSFETVPESDQFKSGGGELASCNASTISRDLLRTTSTVQQCRTEFLTRSPSNKRSVASLESYCKAAGNLVKTQEFLQKNHRSVRSKNSSAGRFSTSDVPDMITAAYPFMYSSSSLRKRISLLVLEFQNS
jgi:hypothetical protein